MNLQEFNTPGDFTVSVPPGSLVLVEAWGAGGGGGGGGGTSSYNDSGNGEARAAQAGTRGRCSRRSKVPSRS
ncbi:hypothetical protein ACFQX6_67245 [Streptosporangium lutulentum]